MLSDVARQLLFVAFYVPAGYVPRAVALKMHVS